jgi:thiamine biosynthesis lipoprotein
LAFFAVILTGYSKTLKRIEKMKNNSKMKIFAYLLTALVLAGMLWLAWTRTRQQAVKVDSGRMILMGTIARIQLYAQDAATGHQALDQAKAALKDIDRLMSTYRDDSELSNVNRLAADQPVTLSPETAYVLQKSQYYSQLTEGAFDITVAPLIAVWKTAADENRLPTEGEISQAQEKIGWQKVELSDSDPPTVRFITKGIKLNVNAIAKGYAVDLALDALKIPGVESALVDIGGEIACFGREWTIGVQDPFAPDTDNQLAQHPSWLLTCQNVAVATSGNYRRYKTIAGRKFSHILDPRTGRPAEKLPSVTVIAPKTIDADALATAISVMGPEDGIKLVESLPEIEAFLIAGTPDNPKFYRSSGFSKYEQSP